MTAGVVTTTRLVDLNVGKMSDKHRSVLNPRNLLRALVPLGLIGLWQLASSFTRPGEVTIIPPPTTVALGFAELWRSGDIQAAIPASLGRAGAGFLIGLVIGLLFGTANGIFAICEELFDSTFQIVRVIPFIAMVPLFVVLFGIDEQFKVILISLACAFPAYLNVYAAVRGVDPKLIEVGRVSGLNQFQVIFRVILPAAWPGILVGVRFAMGTSLLALIVAEQVNSRSGIGYIIYLASSALRIDLIIVGILIYAMLGVLVDVVMRLIEKRSVPWQ